MKHIDGFAFQDGVLHADGVPVPDIADAAGTPTYIYSATAIRAAYRRLHDAFAPLGVHLRFAVKSSPNTHICRLLHELGAGMDVVSGGEMERAWYSGTPMADIVFAGVGKTDEEIRAALDGRFHIRSASRTRAREPRSRESRPGRRHQRRIGLRSSSASPTGAASSAFPAASLYPGQSGRRSAHPRVHHHRARRRTSSASTRRSSPTSSTPGPTRASISIGLHVHIGSPVPEVEPYAEAVEVLLGLVDELAARGHRVEVLDLGGGWPINYTEDQVPPLEDYAARLIPLLADRVAKGLRILMEPGRSILANSGILVTRVQHVKKGRAKTFIIGDAGMHTLIRPALYRAFHFAWPVTWEGDPPRFLEDPGLPNLDVCDLVGPICETGDFLARNRPMPAVERGDLIAVFSAGAYGMSMVSNYNDHGRPAEVLVEGDRARLINKRQPLATVLETESEAPELELSTSTVEV